MSKFNRFKLNLTGARREEVPVLKEGRITRAPCYRRGKRILPVIDLFELVIKVLKECSEITEIYKQLYGYFSQNAVAAKPEVGVHYAMQVLEVMVVEGWVKGKFDPRKPSIKMTTPEEGSIIHSNRDISNNLPAKPSREDKI